MAARRSSFFFLLCLLTLCCSAISVEHKEIIHPVTNEASCFLSFSLLELLEVHKSIVSTFSLLKSKFQNFPLDENITNVVVSSDGNFHPLLLPTLQSIHSTLVSLKLDRKVKVTPMLSVTSLRTLCKSHSENVRKLLSFVRYSESYLALEVSGDETILPPNEFDLSTVQRVLDRLDVPLVIKIRVGKIAMSANEKQKLLEKFAQMDIKVQGVYVEESEQNWWKQDFAESRRVLLDHKDKTNSAIESTEHDITTPVTNPVTTPSTPSAGFVTIPSTDLATAQPTTPEVDVPSTNTATTPISVPATNPATSATIPSSTTTGPVVPVTNPVTTPSNNGQFLPSNTPSNLGQSWCIAKDGVSDTELQLALDYACGVGGVDCSAIEETGSCYNPNTIHDHASYALNSYYQKNPDPTSCDFGGVATLVNTNQIACTTGSTTPVANPTTNGPTPITVPSTIPNPVTMPLSALPPPNSSPGTVPLSPPNGVTGAVPGGPVPSGNSGQTWCVAKQGASDTALRSGINYACGMGGADCSAIQQSGGCYYPNTLHDHVSYAFNSYYVKNPDPTSCDFGGSAMLVTSNPSSGTCTYPSSSTNAPLLNGAAPSGGSTNVIGSSSPIGSQSPASACSSFQMFSCSSLLLALLATLFVR